MPRPDLPHPDLVRYVTRLAAHVDRVSRPTSPHLRLGSTAVRLFAALRIPIAPDEYVGSIDCRPARSRRSRAAAWGARRGVEVHEGSGGERRGAIEEGQIDATPFGGAVGRDASMDGRDEVGVQTMWEGSMSLRRRKLDGQDRPHPTKIRSDMRSDIGSGIVQARPVFSSKKAAKSA